MSRSGPHQDPGKGSLGAGRHGQIAGTTMRGSSSTQHSGPAGSSGQESAGTGAVGAPAAGDIMNSDLQINSKTLTAGETNALG